MSSLGENAEHQDDSFVPDEVQVKVEDVNVDDQFLDDDFNSYSLPSVEKPKEEETDDLFDDGDDVDTTFCIIPCSQKKLRGRPKSSIKKPLLRYYIKVNVCMYVLGMFTSSSEFSYTVLQQIKRIT